MEEKKKDRIYKKLKDKYRLVILNESTFEESLSYRLSPLNVLTLVAALSIFLVSIVIILMAFTPLREYIPGYTDVELRKNLTEQIILTDSLERKILQNQSYIRNVQIILQGGNPDSLVNDDIQIQEHAVELHGIHKSKEDSLLREFVEREDSYSLEIHENSKETPMSQLYFFPPLQGPVTNRYNAKENHFGVDIVAPKDEAIKAALDGTVTFTGWTMETGNVIQVQHSNNIITVYKHNSVLLKEIGDRVVAGEPIAIVGNSGELTSGPHLHFEIWQNGTALDPEEYLNFN